MREFLLSFYKARNKHGIARIHLQAPVGSGVSTGHQVSYRTVNHLASRAMNGSGSSPLTCEVFLTDYMHRIPFRMPTLKVSIVIIITNSLLVTFLFVVTK